MHADLLAQVRAFLARHDKSKSAFGREAVNDSHLIDRLQEGRITLKMGERVRQYMAEYERRQERAQ